MMAKRGAVLYDFLRGAGGAERVALDLTTYFSSDLIVGFEDQAIIKLLGHDPDLSIESLNLNAQNIVFRSYKLIRGFQNLRRNSKTYPWIVYSGNFAPLAVHNHAESKNILYCHSPPRFIYDLKDYYEEKYSILGRPLLRVLISMLKPRYERACHTMDIIIANSSNTQKRIRKFLDKDSVVVYPPCSIEDKEWIGQDGYYLSTARLEPYKRVDLIIKAFRKLPEKKLVITSGGSDERRLKELAAGSDNISFTGWVDEGKLRELLGRAIATLYLPKDEDFGMSPVESMASGKPVIGVREGGLMETIKDMETGILVKSDPAVEDIMLAIEWLTFKRALGMRELCEIRAKTFGRDAFFQNMRMHVES
ncbi:MAG: glycosyl transferase family 1 [Gammaproteobacteria bacterium]|nr:glycosyl transferase family 1 [Gammaproteobacteria bacterium]